MSWFGRWDVLPRHDGSPQEPHAVGREVSSYQVGEDLPGSDCGPAGRVRLVAAEVRPLLSRLRQGGGRGA